MAQCTAPSRGHRSAAAAAACPVCGNSGTYRGFSNYSSTNYSNYSSPSRANTNITTTNSARPSWSSTSSPISYTTQEIRTLTPFRNSIIARKTISVKHDVFLCHAWDDRKNVAKELYDYLETQGVTVWFSEKDVMLGSSLLREIDKGLANSRVGIVLVTPAFLQRIQSEGIADKELSVLLARDLLIPIIHNTTFDKLREVSPMLGSRSGLSTEEDSFEIIATKLSELVAIE